MERDGSRQGRAVRWLDLYSRDPEFKFPTPPPMTTVAGFVLGSEPKFKFTIKHVNSQLVYIGPVGLIINLVMFI